MKKLFSILLVTILAISVCFAVAGCDPSGKDDGGKTPGGGTTPGGGGGGGTVVADEFYKDSPFAERWYSTDFIDSIDGEWDSSVLPDVFPDKPATGTIAGVTTSHKAKTQRTISENWYVGMVDFPDARYEYYEVRFYGQTAHVEYLETALETAGLIVVRDYDMSDNLMALHAFSDDWYVFVNTHTQSGEPTHAGCPQYFDVLAVPDQHTAPASFQGIPLPQFGYLTGDMTYWDWDSDEECALTTTPGAHWDITEQEFYGVTQAQLAAYKTALTGAGFTALDTEESTYAKNDLQVRIVFNADKGLLTFYATSDDTVRS